MSGETGPAHYLHAEDLANQAENASNEGHLEKAAVLAAVGQVHATLAAAAATALNDSSRGMDTSEYAAWSEVAGET